MRVVLTGGGTAGHLLPFEGIISALRTLHSEQMDSLPKRVQPRALSIQFLGVVDARVREFFAAHDVSAANIPSGKLRRYASARTISDVLFWLPLGILAALWRMYFLMPDVVISKGGYGSVPTVLAAAFYRIPVVLHESDAVLGLANRKLAKHARAITLGFAAAAEQLGKYAYKGFITGTPVRDSLTRISREEARATFQIPREEQVLLVMGGSQGAKQVNEALLAFLPKLILDVTVIHVTGEAHWPAVTAVAGELLAQSSRKDFYRPFAYLAETMPHALVAADFVVSRAGAQTLAELAALRLPALLIPLPGAAQDHQRANAHVFESAGAALVLDPENTTPSLFESNVQRLLMEEDTRAQLKENLAALDYPKAARGISDIALRLAAGLAPERA